MAASAASFTIFHKISCPKKMIDTEELKWKAKFCSLGILIRTSYSTTIAFN